MFLIPLKAEECLLVCFFKHIHIEVYVSADTENYVPLLERQVKRIRKILGKISKTEKQNAFSV